MNLSPTRHFSQRMLLRGHNCLEFSPALLFCKILIMVFRPLGSEDMNTQYWVVVICGGVVGASVLYYLAKFDWTDVALIERSVLTAG